MATTRVEIENELLERLRARHPGKDDRALVEGIARVELGLSVLRAAQHRNAWLSTIVFPIPWPRRRWCGTRPTTTSCRSRAQRARMRS